MLQIILADFKERTRRYSYLITLGFVLFFGYLVNTGKYAIKLGEYRGEYNSAWVGSLMAMGATTMLLFAGFFLVKNSIQRDYTTGVGQILATTPLTKFSYLLAKFFSHILTLSTMVFFLILSAVIMQLFGQSKEGFDLWVLISPFLFTTIPAIILVSSLAVFFESVEFLKGTLGNVIYFFVAEGVLMIGFFTKNIYLDISGISTYLPSMESAAKAAFPNAKLGLSMGFVGFVEKESNDISLFLWDGIDWTLELIMSKVIWIGVAVFFLFLASVFFKRFDLFYKVKKEKKIVSEEEIAKKSVEGNLKIHFKDLTQVNINFRFIDMLIADFRLRAKGFHWVWYIIYLTTIILQLILPIKFSTAIILPIALIWPISIWSSLGTIEKQNNTEQFIKVSPFSVSRLLPAAWGTGLFFALLSSSGLLIRYLILFDFSHIMSLINAVIFIPSLAIFLGILSGSKKLFEILYMLLWYLGPINGLEIFNYLGVSNTSPHYMGFIYLFLSAIMLSFVFVVYTKKN